MADYIYLLQTRLTSAQQSALEEVRKVAKARLMTVFLVGGAVRDLLSGAPIRDLDLAVQGNALKLNKELQKAGGILAGEDESTQCLYYTFAGGVRLSVGSTLSVSYPKPGKPVYKPATILDDLHRRDFTANAMALSLNDGSFGLLMDPLNGVADIENRELRLVSNYGFLEDPSRMIRAARLTARLGWQMEEKTRQRYENAKAENAIAALQPWLKHYELEEIFHEEDPLRVLRHLETEGWATALSSAWSSAKVNAAELDRLRDAVGRLETMGIYPEPSAAYFPLLTAKLGSKEVAGLKKSFARPGFVEQIEGLEADTKAFAALFGSKAAAAPSDAWKMLFAAKPEAVLWLAHSNKSATIKERLDAFFNEWALARQKIPYQVMQEMRITPALPEYGELVERLFYSMMDGKLETPEAIRAFLEPYSPPAPAPSAPIRRKAAKREAKMTKPRGKKPTEAQEGLTLAAAAEQQARTGIAPAETAAARPQTTAKPAVPVKPAAAAAGKDLQGKPAVADAKLAGKSSAPAPVNRPAAKSDLKTEVKPSAQKKKDKSLLKKVFAKKPAKKNLPRPAVKAALAKKLIKKTVAKPTVKKAVAKPVLKKSPRKSVAHKKPLAQAASRRQPVGKAAQGKPAAAKNQKGTAPLKKPGVGAAKNKPAVRPASGKRAVKVKPKSGSTAKTAKARR